MRQYKKFWSIALAAVLLVHTVPVVASSKQTQTISTSQTQKNVPQEITKALDIATEYILKSVSKPQYGSVGGEWAVFGLARRGIAVPKGYYEEYYKHIQETVKTEHTKQSRRWKLKVTETQRLAIAVAAIGKDPTNVGGVNLIDYSFNKGKNMPDLPQADKALGNRQGLNELAFGLIAMDLKKTPQPKSVEVTRNEIISKMIKDYQTSDGGFNLSSTGKTGEVDITAMTIQALAPYYNQKGFEHVTQAVENALSFLSKKQSTKGGMLDANCESTAQVVVALCSLGIDPAKDTRFIKKGNTLTKDLLSYQLSSGGFEHVKGQGINQMASEQAYYALVAYERLLLGKSRIYDMTGTE